MLEIDQLTLQRGTQTLRYDLQVAEKTLLTIQGKSGSGKSTLLDLVAGFISPQGGSMNGHNSQINGDIRWQGKSLLGLSAEQRPVSMLFQAHNLFQHLSVLQNLHLGLSALLPAQRDQQINAAATTLGVSDLLRRKPGQLSGGQQQRIALIRTLLRPEPLILLDEPFSGLDDESRILCADWVRAQVDHAGKTVLLVTHQDDDVVRIADRNFQLDESN